MASAKHFAETTDGVRPIKLPHPGKASLRDDYNNLLKTLIEAIWVEGGEGADPRLAFWAPDDTIDEFRKGFDKDGLFTWLSSMFDFQKDDRGVGSESPLLDLVLRFEESLAKILSAPSCKAKLAPLRFSVDLQGPVEAVERIERVVDNAAIYAFIIALQKETLGLGGHLVRTFRGGKPGIAVRSGLEILCFFELPFLPLGPNGETLNLPVEEERSRYWHLD
jgi:hypothetical protein